MDKADAYVIIDKEINALFEKPLTTQSVDLLYKLTNIRTNINNVAYKPQNEPQTHSNDSKYDRNINELLDAFVMARKSGNTELSNSTLADLLGELSDLVVEIYNSALCKEEREIITSSIEKMARH